MTRIGIIYGSSTNRTMAIAEDIAEALGVADQDLIDAGDCEAAHLRDFDLIIAGVSTWDHGTPQHDWADLLDRLGDLDLHGRRIAVFGLGDALSYPRTYQDGMGSVYDALTARGGEAIGAWSTDGYRFERSAAIRDGRFCGLALDEDNEEDRTAERLAAWLDQIGRETALA